MEPPVELDESPAEAPEGVVRPPAGQHVDGPEATPVPGASGPPARPGSWWSRLLDRLGAVSIEAWITFGVVAASSLFVLLQLQPSLLVADTTPAGGDMGAHVWGPAYLRDHLLPNLRLTGWTPDWYAGFPAYHFYMVIPSLLIVLLDVVLPYGVAFKLVSVSGLVLMPVAAWAFGRLAGVRFPGPATLAVATVPFLFDRSFTIYGGNIASTLAGEFAFSISLSIALVALGVVFKGLETGRYRALAAVLLALTALCHLIPAGFALVGTVLAVLFRLDRQRLWWAVTMAPVAAALTAWWVLPFMARHAYLNDMGWEKLTDYTGTLFKPDHYALIVLAGVGLLICLATRQRLGLYLGVFAAVWAVAFVLMPQHRLWNARLLPFWLLCLYLLVGVGFAEAGRVAARGLAAEPGRSRRVVLGVTPVLALFAALVVVGMPLRVLPLGAEVTKPNGETVYRWLAFETSESSFIPSWAAWNYSGYERKPAYPEYYGIVSTMAELGETNGCGRAMWEHANSLDRYGTPMALMLLPFWTDGCIGSMEGLYFEASATTPFHFLNQSELSAAPSRAMRDMPYRELDVAQGVRHLQLMGVKYYMAFSPEAIAQARNNPDLVEVASSPPWVVFEVADPGLGNPSPPAGMVTPLRNTPAVLDGLPGVGGRAWLDPAVDWYQDESAWDVFLAEDGPEDWPRVTPGQQPDRALLPPVTVSDVQVDRDRISFRVDRTGVPVLIRTSYFPTWAVDGAEGPWRVTPNFMVVVPTENEVVLADRFDPLDWFAYLLTLAGIVGVVVLARRPPVAVPPAPAWGIAADGEGADREGGGAATEEAPGPVAGIPGADGNGSPDGVPGPGRSGPDPQAAGEAWVGTTPWWNPGGAAQAGDGGGADAGEAPGGPVAGGAASAASPQPPAPAEGPPALPAEAREVAPPPEPPGAAPDPPA